MDRNKIFGKVIRQLRKAAALNQEQLSEKSGVDQGAISRMENGKYKFPESHLSALASALDHRPSEILAMVDEAADGIADGALTIPPPRPGLQALPLIGWIRAGGWDQVENPFDPEIAEGTVYTSEKVSRRAYALMVKGDSMTNPRGWPTFPVGTRIIVEPKRSAGSGDLVVAQLVGEEEATFKRLVHDGGRSYLVPLNPQYPTLPVDREVRILGVVIAVAERSILDS